MSYERYYETYKECDFCGQMTRGRIYPNEKEKVRCGSCNRIIDELEVKE